MSQSEYPELDSIKGLSISALGFDPDEAEWYVILSNGRRLTLSAMGDAAYFYLSEVMH